MATATHTVEVDLHPCPRSAKTHISSTLGILSTLPRGGVRVESGSKRASSGSTFVSLEPAELRSRLSRFPEPQLVGGGSFLRVAGGISDILTSFLQPKERNKDRRAEQRPAASARAWARAWARASARPPRRSCSLRRPPYLQTVRERGQIHQIGISSLNSSKLVCLPNSALLHSQAGLAMQFGTSSLIAAVQMYICL